MGNPGWSYNDVLPYFMMSEDNMQLNEVDNGFHSTGGMLPISKFPYHPPLSYAILRAGQELGKPLFHPTRKRSMQLDRFFLFSLFSL